MVRFSFVTALVPAVAAFSMQVMAGEAANPDASARLYSSAVKTHPSQGDVRTVEGAEAIILTTRNGAFVSITTNELTPGNAYTLWFVAINAPEACESSPCAPTDVLGRSTETISDIGYADGLIAGEDGIGRFAAFIPTGDLRQAWLGNGYRNVQGAEIYLVVNDHGPLIADSARNMITSYRGGCADDSLPGAFPATAKGDGKPGPNACRLVQTATVVFQTADGQTK